MAIDGQSIAIETSCTSERVRVRVSVSVRDFGQFRAERLFSHL